MPGQLTLPASAGRATFLGAVHSEFTKIRSVRSTYWTLIALVLVTVGIGALAGFASTRSLHGPGFDATQASLGGLYLSQLIIAVLGVLVISAEYSTGMVRTTLTTFPYRGTIIAAKALVFGAVAFVTGLVTCFISFFVGQAVMSTYNPRTLPGGPGQGISPLHAASRISVSIGDPNVLRAIIGGALFLTVSGLLAFGIGLLLRHTAGAISTVVGLLFVLTILINLLPASWLNHVDKWMPAVAGTQIWTTVASHGNPPVFAPWTGFAVFAVYAAVVVIGGAILFRTRDA
jgi:ABC-type transport system involved in multi-copper enzyme maturation permease subunit